MKTQPILQLPADVYATVHAHLLPRPQRLEQAAFMFVHPNDKAPDTFKYVDWFPVPRTGFVVQLPYHFELTDDTRAAMIKRAHDLRASVVELHSHIGPFRPQFSPSDWSGFEQLVPHMFWRLKGKPYFALVFANHGFDGLAWISDSKMPVRIGGIQVSDDLDLKEPSRLSPLERDGYDWTAI